MVGANQPRPHDAVQLDGVATNTGVREVERVAVQVLLTVVLFCLIEAAASERLVVRDTLRVLEPGHQ